MERQGFFKGRHLHVSNVKARTLSIAYAPELSDQVDVKVTFDDEKEFEALTVTEGDSVKVVGAPSRGSSTIFASRVIVGGDLVGRSATIDGVEVTMDVQLRVPRGFTIRLESAFGDVTIGDVEGVLHLDLSGAAAVTAGKTKTLDLDMSGSGKVKVSRIVDGATIEVSGAGDVAIGTIEGGSLDVEVSGSAGVKVEEGTADALSIDLSGAGRVEIGAHIEGNAKIDASGVGKVTVASISGRVEQDTSGVASVKIGSQGGQGRKF